MTHRDIKPDSEPDSEPAPAGRKPVPQGRKPAPGAGDLAGWRNLIRSGGLSACDGEPATAPQAVEGDPLGPVTDDEWNGYASQFHGDDDACLAVERDQLDDLLEERRQRHVAALPADAGKLLAELREKFNGPEFTDKERRSKEGRDFIALLTLAEHDARAQQWRERAEAAEKDRDAAQCFEKVERTWRLHHEQRAAKAEAALAETQSPSAEWGRRAHEVMLACLTQYEHCPTCVRNKADCDRDSCDCWRARLSAVVRAWPGDAPATGVADVPASVQPVAVDNGQPTLRELLLPEGALVEVTVSGKLARTHDDRRRQYVVLDHAAEHAGFLAVNTCALAARTDARFRVVGNVQGNDNAKGGVT